MLIYIYVVLDIDMLEFLVLRLLHLSVFEKHLRLIDFMVDGLLLCLPMCYDANEF